jgi:hypothetical protein
MKVITMKSSLAAAALALLVGCQNPYLAQMNAVDAAYARGDISRSEYNTRMGGLQAQSDAWASQNAANAALASNTLAAASIVTDVYNTNKLSRSIENQPTYYGGGGGGGKPSKPSGGKKKPSQPSGGKKKPSQPSQPSGPPPR